MADKSLTVIIPGLAPLLTQEIAAGLLPKHLKQSVKYGKRTAEKATLSRQLFSLFSKHALQGNDLPDIALSGINTGIRVSPCYLQADRDQLHLFGPEQLAITPTEAAALITLIQPLMPAQLKMEEVDKWHLSLPEQPAVALTALADVNGRAVQVYLPAGEAATSWIQLWNEIQMVLHECAINTQRIAEGKLPINSVWFWGKGAFEAATERWASVSGINDDLSRLAIFAGVTVQPTASKLHDLTAGKHLMLLPTISLEQDIESQLIDLENTIFKPVMAALKWRKLSRVRFVFPELAYYDATLFSAWKFW